MLNMHTSDGNNLMMALTSSVTSAAAKAANHPKGEWQGRKKKKKTERYQYATDSLYIDRVDRVML